MIESNIPIRHFVASIYRNIPAAYAQPMSLGENIRQARRALGLNQDAIGEALGLEQGTVSKWETGKSVPSILLLPQLALLLRASTDALLRGISEDYDQSRVVADQTSAAVAKNYDKTEEGAIKVDRPPGISVAKPLRRPGRDALSESQGGPDSTVLITPIWQELRAIRDSLELLADAVGDKVVERLQRQPSEQTSTVDSAPTGERPDARAHRGSSARKTRK